MKKPKQEEIPGSIIKGGDTIYADLNSSKGEGNLLFLSPKCVVVGLHHLPYTLFTTPEFNENILPLNIKKDIYEVKEFVLQPSFSMEADKSIMYCIIPKWLTNFKKIESLRIGYVELDNLDYLMDLPIQHLTFKYIKCNDAKKLITVIKQFKHLKEISYGQSFPVDIQYSLKTCNFKLTIIDESD